MTRETRDFTAAPMRGRFEAWILDAAAGRMHEQHGEHKAQVLQALEGTIVEIGPGTGANLRYYPPGVHVIGIEPNPAMHQRLRDKASRLGVDLEIRALHGERMDVQDGSADAVVGTLVLCGVDDPEQVVAEVKRVLKPGGTYYFLEHVVAPEGTIARRAQALLRRPHRWLFNGCEVDRDTGRLLEEAGFTSLELDQIDAGPSNGHLRYRIAGIARR